MPKSWKTLFFSQIILISVLSLSLSYANASTNLSLTSYIVDGTITTLGCHIINGNITNETTLMRPIQICTYKNFHFQIMELTLGTGCIQVIAHWKDPHSGHVHTFPNPCDAPQFLNPRWGNVTGTEPIPSSHPSIDPPLKQFKSGIALKDIVCRHSLQIVVKKDGLPACLKPQTAQKLVERGWGTIVTSPTPTSCLTGQVMINGQCVTSIPINPTSKCSTGYSVIQISVGSYLCQPTNPPPLSNATTYSVGQKVGVFTISTINPYNVTGYYNSPYPIGRPGLGDFTIMHVGDTLNPTCDGSAPLVITAINYPNSITVSIGKSMGKPYGGCPICLSANSVIGTPNGDVNVKDIKDGMIVWSTDSNGIMIKSKVIKINNVFVGDTHKVVDLQLADGRELFVSPNHPTYDDRIIADLKGGETYDGSTVKSIGLVPYKYQFTYDILPDSQTGNYWANGILVGSTLK